MFFREGQLTDILRIFFFENLGELKRALLLFFLAKGTAAMRNTDSFFFFLRDEHRFLVTCLFRGEVGPNTRRTSSFGGVAVSPFGSRVRPSGPR